MKGSNPLSQVSVYGSQGVSAPANTSGARYYITWWRNTSSGNLRLFAGLGLTSVANEVEILNDLWKFKLPCSADSAKALPKLICSGKNAVITAYNQFPSLVYWYNTPTGVSAGGPGSTLSTATLTAQTTQSVYTFYAEANTCTLEPRSMFTITVLPLP